MIRKQVYVTEYQSDAIRHLADKDGVKMSEIVRRALDTYLAMRTDGTTLLIGEREKYDENVMCSTSTERTVDNH